MRRAILITIIFYCSFNLTEAQRINQENTSGKTSFLLGIINKEGLTSTNYNSWFSKNYDDYQPEESVINELVKNLKDYDILLFMGTWCGDSKREVPRFYKILETANFPMEKLTAVALSNKAGMYKKSPGHEEKGLNIHRVPTFIFFKDGKEVNRIVEEPVDNLEKDILEIITSNTYESNYQIVTVVDDILKKKGINGFKRQQKKLLKKYGNEVSSMFELNTYGRILFADQKIEESLAVFEFNTKLFPDQPRAYMSFANTLGASGHKDKAISVLETAITIHPENDDLKENLGVIKSN
ncbi:MAG: hypothetical protein HKN96_07865 [Flavobacteriaceae bacterium]|nr:hypothetical protein [Flavobacteriaceae bacterium]NNK27812.1 hypothetical protein [Flavobacteriaceae bacterium]NNL79232.1 hypothetical protein [Flavobacteriaceae bacterium]